MRPVLACHSRKARANTAGRARRTTGFQCLTLKRCAACPPSGMKAARVTPTQKAKGRSHGACHRCSAVLRDPRKAAICACGTSYHVYDCGRRCAAAGVADGAAAVCPVCTRICSCRGGDVVCHTNQLKARRAGVQLRPAGQKRRVGATPGATPGVRCGGEGGCEAVAAAGAASGGGAGEHSGATDQAHLDFANAVQTALKARVLYEAVLLESCTYEGAVPLDLN